MPDNEKCPSSPDSRAALLLFANQIRGWTVNHPGWKNLPPMPRRYWQSKTRRIYRSYRAEIIAIDDEAFRRLREIIAEAFKKAASR
jgi:hypothetical protein